MKTKYVRMQAAEREEISRGLAAGWTFSHIAHNISRPVSTVSREVGKNCIYKRCYRAGAAGNKAQRVRHRQKQLKVLEADDRLRNYVIENLRLKWLL